MHELGMGSPSAGSTNPLPVNGVKGINAPVIFLKAILPYGCRVRSMGDVLVNMQSDPYLANP
jgi:hypothetical protein